MASGGAKPPASPPDRRPPLTAPTVTPAETITAIPAADWDALATPAPGRPLDPFTTHRFLAALERSGSTGPGTGWLSRPLLVHRGNRLIAAAPLYVKSHSQGEYVFDHGWAEAWTRAGGQYYPKLQIAVPFTPVTGPRLLTLPGEEAIGRQALIEGAIAVARQNQLSSLHITFCTPEEAAAPGLMHRIGQQFHWLNQGYASHDDFLASLASRKRKALKRERAAANAHGLTIRNLTGDDLRPEHWDAFWAFYQETGSRKWGRPYLTRAFFEEIQRTMRDDVLLVMAFDGARPVAGALNFIGRDCLYGRYWGALADYPFLHFELCYHRAIDFAIEHRLARVEAGAQGEHKLARGYLPVETHSLHWIADPGFSRAVAEFLDRERAALDEEIEFLTALGPFRRGPARED